VQAGAGWTILLGGEAFQRQAVLDALLEQAIAPAGINDRALTGAAMHRDHNFNLLQQSEAVWLIKARRGDMQLLAAASFTAIKDVQGVSICSQGGSQLCCAGFNAAPMRSQDGDRTRASPHLNAVVSSFSLGSSELGKVGIRILCRHVPILPERTKSSPERSFLF
jgi:hypothetical protein